MLSKEQISCRASYLRFKVAAVERHLHEVEVNKWIHMTIVGFVAGGQTPVIHRQNTVNKFVCNPYAGSELSPRADPVNYY
jgi:hypothetical protein